MKIIKILGIAAGLHAVLALILIFASPGCSSTKAADTGSPAITAAPAADAPAPAAIIAAPDSATIRYSPTRPGTAVASALEEQPVSDVTPASTYTVAHGDSLSSIAKKNKLTKADLAAANNLKSSSLLHPGQKLIIPSKQLAAAAAVPAPTAAAAEPAGAEKSGGDVQKHVVAPGETLSGIAHRYGIKQGDIAVANNITDPKRIQPGQELIIPAKSAAAGGKQARSASPRAEAPEAAKSASPPAGDQDLDAGLKTPAAAEVPVVKIEDSSTAPQPKNP